MFQSVSHETHPLVFESCGEFVSRGEWIHPRRIIGSYEIIAVLAGKVYLKEGADSYVLEKNHILLLSPNVEHEGTRTSRDVSFFWLHFRSDAVFDQKHFVFSDTDSASLLSLFRILLHDVNTPFYPQSSAEYLTRLILNEISYLSDRNNSENAVARKAAEFIAANLHRRPTVADIAARFGYHPDYFTRLFRKAYGQSIGAFIADQTMKSAKTMLCTSGKTIAEVAHALGFENANAFTNFFKYHEGITPSRYATLYPNTHINRA